MSQFSMEESQLKAVLKAAITEVLEEKRDLLREAVEEALEDIGMLNAMQAGESSEEVSRDEVFKILEAEP